MNNWKIRPFQIKTDLDQTAELIELSFDPFLDTEGHIYLQRLRDTCLKWKKFPFTFYLSHSNMIPAGIVCETTDQRIIGHISLFPITVSGENAFLIANVCVHPDFRRNHIAEDMMKAALNISVQTSAKALYLQTRREVPESTEMYLKLGFSEDTRRTEWKLPFENRKSANEGAFFFSKSSISEKKTFDFNFAHFYPASIYWNLNYDPHLFLPGWKGFIRNQLSGRQNSFDKIVDPNGRILCWTVWQEMSGSTDSVWFIPNGDISDEEAEICLVMIGDRYEMTKQIQINTQQNFLTSSFQAAGYQIQSQLIWMSKRIN